MAGNAPSENDHTSTIGEYRQLRYHHWVRLLRIVSLLQKDYVYTPAKLCEELQVSLRTLQRDIALLRSLGVKVSSGPGRYWMRGPRW